MNNLKLHPQSYLLCRKRRDMDVDIGDWLPDWIHIHVEFQHVMLMFCAVCLSILGSFLEWCLKWASYADSSRSTSLANELNLALANVIIFNRSMVSNKQNSQTL